MSFQESVQALLDQINGDVGEDMEDWLEELAATIMLARALADLKTNFREAKGPNAAALRSRADTLHQRCLAYLNYLHQRAYFLWGVNLPQPKGYKSEDPA